MNLNNFTYTFPYQKRSTAAKGKKFCVECLESALGQTALTSNLLKQTKTVMKINWDLRHDILDERDVENAVNPWKIEGASFPGKMQNHPLINSKIDLLLGEELKRAFDWHVFVTNSDAVSQKQVVLRDKINELVLSSLMNKDYSEEELKVEIEKLSKWHKYEYKDIRERRATQYLTYLFKQQKLPLKFNQGFEYALVLGEEIYCVDVIGNEPIVRVCDPQTITAIRNGSSTYIEDADIIIEDVYLPFGQVIDMFYDYLTPNEIDKLERGYSGKEDFQLSGYNQSFGAPVNPFVIDGIITDDDGKTFATSVDITKYMNPTNVTAYDQEGNVRLVRVVWKSLRKLGEITYYDDDGNRMVKLVDENYEPDLERGETVDWFWVSEWWETNRIGDHIYVKYGPRPIQFRHMNNKSICGSGYVGTIYPYSIMDRGKGYQYLYNMLMYRTELAFAKSKGKIGIIDFSKIPDNWTIDKWLYYAEVLGWAVEDPFNEGQKGAALGKLAGSMNQNNRYIDVELGSYIQQHVLMLQFIEEQLGEVVGITKQRQGQIENRETVGGIERATTQSSHITERLFAIHDDTKLRVLEVLLETAKYAWRDRLNEKLQYISDELSHVVVEVDGPMFNESEYGIMVTNSANITRLMQSIESLAQAALQNDKMNFSTLLSIYFSDSISSMRRKIEQSEEETLQRNAEQAQAERDNQMQIAQMAAQTAQAERDLKESMNDKDNLTNLQIAALKTQDQETPTVDLDTVKQNWTKIENDWRKSQETLKLKKQELEEKVRHNKVTEKKPTAKLKR